MTRPYEASADIRDFFGYAQCSLQAPRLERRLTPTIYGFARINADAFKTSVPESFIAGEVPNGIKAAIRSSTDAVFVVRHVLKDATPEDTALSLSITLQDV